LGVFGGFYTVPLYALLQMRSKPEIRSRVIANNNIINALFMVVSGVLVITLFAIGFSIPEIFLATAILNALVAIYIYCLLPEFVLRFIVWLLVHTFYRLRAKGLEYIPDTGPVILVCNHTSYVDALILASACRRPIRFVMYYKIFDWPILRFVFKTSRAIPIASANEDKDLLQKAYDKIADALAKGEIICIFPEGKITRSGRINKFKPGIIKMAHRSAVPVVPMALRGLWGSIFSRNKKRWHLFCPLRKVGLYIGPPVMPDKINTADLYAEVRALKKGVHANSLIKSS